MTDSMGYAIDIDVKIHDIIQMEFISFIYCLACGKIDFLRMCFFHFDILTQHI